MSKKYFINNVDSAFGKVLLDELVKQPTDDPTHMCTVLQPVNTKPNGIKKILKRDKPKLFRKKVIQECEVYVYSLDETEISDIQFGIDTMLKPFEDNKVFILVSDIMAWSNNHRKIKLDKPKTEVEGEDAILEGQQQDKKSQSAELDKQKSENERSSQGVDQESGEEDGEEIVTQKQIQYTYFQDVDYEQRQPLPKYNYIKEIQDKVLQIKNQNVRIFVICPGVIYGCGENIFYPLFRAAWLQQPKKLPFLTPGTNQIPTIHIKDLARFVIKVGQSIPQGSPYLLAFDQTSDKKQSSIIQAISNGIGSQLIEPVQSTSLIENIDPYIIDIDIHPSKALVGTADQPTQFQWVAQKGLSTNIKLLLKDFCQKQQLQPMKILLFQSQGTQKQNVQYILKIFSKYYQIPILSIKQMLQYARQYADNDLIQDLQQEWNNIMNYVMKNQQILELSESMKVFYRAIRWRLKNNDCANRGYILYNCPKYKAQIENIFKKASIKKFKSKKPKKKIILPVATQSANQSKKSIEGQEINEDEANKNDDIEPKAEEEDKPEQQQKQQEEEQVIQEEQGASKFQIYYPESMLSIKRSEQQCNENVIDYFTSNGIEEMIYDTTGKHQHQIFESLRTYIERNGRPNNYLVPEQQLLNQHKQFTKKVNKENMQKKTKNLQEQNQLKKQAEEKRKKFAEEIYEIVREQGEQQIKKMPFRNYLMQFVVPTLNVGLLQVSNIIPNDPVDLLAEFLYQKSYDA